MFLHFSKNDREHSPTINKQKGRYKFSLIRTEDDGSIQPWKESYDYQLLWLNSQSKKDLPKAESTIRLGRSQRHKTDDIKAYPKINTKLIRLKQAPQQSQRHKQQKPLQQSQHKTKTILSCTATPQPNILGKDFISPKDSEVRLGHVFKNTISPKKNIKALTRRSIDLIGQTITLDVRNSQRNQRKDCLRNIKEFQKYRKRIMQTKRAKDLCVNEFRRTLFNNKQNAYARWLQKQCEQLSFLLRKRS